MANIWKAQSKVNNKIKRNNHDLSKKSNISLKFGTLYPVYCKKVFPGDSFSIDTAFNLKLQPVIFPVQTKMRAHMHYFYVRNKNLWSGWEDWITGLRTNEETPHPYLNVRDSDIKTSSIHDFLGVPTSLALSSDAISISRCLPVPVADEEQLSFFYFSSWAEGQKPVNASLVYDSSKLSGFISILPDTPIGTHLSYSSALSTFFETYGFPTRALLVSCPNSFGFPPPYLPSEFIRVRNFASFEVSHEGNSLVIPQNISKSISDFITDPSDRERTYGLCLYYDTYFESEVERPVMNNHSEFVFEINFANSSVQEYSELGIDLFSQHLHLNALPYRAYESIYNAFYRNTQVDPLIINGRTEYNKFVENMGDGADNFNYHLHQRNYELDFLTSALPSPQQGVAPLVGMTALGDITIEDENGITTAKATVDDDGTITDVVVTSPAASIEHQRVAMSLAQFGLNIQDFRNANAYLRLLETSIRKGYRYIENILGHWGVAPKHNVLDMPEFIGGFSRDVQVSTVVSSADTLGSDGLSLGDYGGYAQLVGGSKSPVRHFCDDHGFIIGILSVVPTPCYSQLLPKQMIAPTSYLDYYFPEFDQIGYQPITYKEVAPIQSYLDSLTDSNKRLEDTFGYQRPNYDLVGDVDEVHGLFRTDFRNYVINRIFDTRPELGHDFISINPSEINQIFVDTNPDDDCIIGEIGFAVHTKRPVSRVVIPGLGH